MSKMRHFGPHFLFCIFIRMEDFFLVLIYQCFITSPPILCLHSPDMWVNIVSLNLLDVLLEGAVTATGWNHLWLWRFSRHSHHLPFQNTPTHTRFEHAIITFPATQHLVATPLMWELDFFLGMGAALFPASTICKSIIHCWAWKGVQIGRKILLLLFDTGPSVTTQESWSVQWLLIGPFSCQSFSYFLLTLGEINKHLPISFFVHLLVVATFSCLKWRENIKLSLYWVTAPEGDVDLCVKHRLDSQCKSHKRSTSSNS